MNLTVLGSQGAIPKLGKYSTSLLLNISNSNILIDCCEGVQHQLRKYKIKLSKIDIILISHAHGDHYFGLIGLISTLSLLKRDKKLTVFCPTSVLKIIQSHIKYSRMSLNYNLDLKSLNNKSEEIIFEDFNFIIKAFPLKHSVYTNGFRIKEKKKRRKLLLKKAIEFKIDKVYYNKLTKSENVFNEDGEEIDYLKVTAEGPKSKSFAYCSDTVYFDKLVDYIKCVDLLYCETTFLEKDRDKALSTLHSTTTDAANLANKGTVKQLLIGHFSSRYDDYSNFLKEVKLIFDNVVLSEEGKNIQV
ncbi:MAG: ribonuclease [Flavobacteriaceae bacterium]|nr:ribonuclease [Flavobacteriaceae bacterium]MAU31387.1 ribonuclease [Flavobacteriaceae bacterium]